MEIIINKLDTTEYVVEQVSKAFTDLFRSGEEKCKSLIKLSLDTTKPEDIEVIYDKPAGTVMLTYILYGYKNFCSTVIHMNALPEGGFDVAVRDWLSVVGQKLRDFRALEEMEQAVYEAYQLDWLMSRGYSLRDAYDVIVSLAGESLDFEDCAAPADSAGVVALSDMALSRFTGETGFNGELFASKAEFLTGEFCDSSYMDGLFDRMYKGAEWKVLYEKAFGGAA